MAFTAPIWLWGASWRSGERRTIDEAWPLLLGLDPDPAVVAAMRTVALIDADGRIPEPALDRWYGPARERLEQARFLLQADCWPLHNGAGEPRASPGNHRENSERRLQATRWAPVRSSVPAARSGACCDRGEWSRAEPLWVKVRIVCRRLPVRLIAAG